MTEPLADGRKIDSGLQKIDRSRVSQGTRMELSVRQRAALVGICEGDSETPNLVSGSPRRFWNRYVSENSVGSQRLTYQVSVGFSRLLRKARFPSSPAAQSGEWLQTLLRNPFLQRLLPTLAMSIRCSVAPQKRPCPILDLHAYKLNADTFPCLQPAHNSPVLSQSAAAQSPAYAG